MKLIIESGATKADCCLIDGDGAVRSSFRTGGINLASMDESTVSQRAGDAVSFVLSGGFVPEKDVTEVFFYGAGVIGEDDFTRPYAEKQGNQLDKADGKADDGKDAVRKAFPGAVFHFNSDLMAAARGLYGDGSGIVAILGTGSNSCLYRGGHIVRNIRPGGFILGDEGSAAALGRLFLADYVKDMLPVEVADAFYKEYSLEYEDVVRLVYRSPAPAASVAAFAPFIVRWQENHHVRPMIRRNFMDFIERSLLRYLGDTLKNGEDKRNVEVRVTGSFGCACRELLQETGRGCGISFTSFVPAPMDGLIEYHRTH